MKTLIPRLPVALFMSLALTPALRADPASRPQLDVNVLDGEVLGLHDPLKSRRPAPDVAGPTPPASVTPPVADASTSIAGLPPEVAAEVRRQLADRLVQFLGRRNDLRRTLDNQLQEFGGDSREATATESALTALDRQIDAIKAVLAEPLPVATPVPPAPPTGWVVWLDRNSGPIFAGLVAVTLLAIVPLRLMMTSGRGRAVVLGVFGLMLAGGVGQLFAAGVVLGMGRPADAWVTLLGGAAILIVCGGLMLRQARAYYAGVELRKLRAMDVG